MKPPMTDLNRLIARQEFKNLEEAEAFFNSLNLTGMSLDDLPKVDLTAEEQAQDLVHEAYDLAPAKAKKNVEKALELDPNCIEAYEYLASREKALEISLVFCDKGIAIGRKKFGGKFLKENKGIFWGIHETRPFMRCLYNKAEWLITDGKMVEAVEIMEEMLQLNEGDNLGVRFPLMSALIVLGETEKFKKYDKMFADDKYSAAMLYSRALFAFKTEGDSANTRKKLDQAAKANPFVIQRLFDGNINHAGLDAYRMGSPEEAEIYVLHSGLAWHKTEGAMRWLTDTATNVAKKNKPFAISEKMVLRTIAEQLDWNKKFPLTNSWAIFNAGIKISFGWIDDFAKEAGDKFAEVKFRLFTLKEFLKIYNEKPKTLVSKKNSGLNKFIIFETFKTIVLVKEIEQNLLSDISEDLNEIGEMIGDNDQLMKTAMFNGLDVNWLIRNEIPKDISEKETDLREQGFLK